ncbi:glucosaminidase domain-containing protein [Candidatus Curtissbacteria bacterium]|nr:glucosaminidase domain-containing protein [Candidatus Curtissbacteria bacterium]
MAAFNYINIDTEFRTWHIGIMPKKLGLFFMWMVLTPIVLGLSTFLLLTNTARINQIVSTTGSLVAQESKTNTLDGQILGTEIFDMRPYLIASTLQKTVLAPYAAYMVEISDKYGIDYRLIPAIAMKESGGGNKAPKDTYNAWGFENGKTRFDSWEQAIDIVGKTLKVRYVDKGLVTAEQIMPVYAPPAVEAGGKWARDINYFFSKMESFQ